MRPARAELTVPLHITVWLGESMPERPAPVTLAPLEAVRPRSYYDGYTGYETEFLGTEVPLPELSDEQRRNAARDSHAEPGQDPTVLRYTHFSVVMNRRRQLAYYTVVNIDGSQRRDVERERDTWYLDSRIAESEQIGEALYARNRLDRGHLVRRLDPVWGADAVRANDDTFHFTNCAPQHERFNQGRDLWQGLENFILDHAELTDQRMTVFTGPVMTDDDPLYKGVRLPLAYWKIIAYRRAGTGLAVAGYLLDQTQLIEDMLGFGAAFDAGTYRVRLDALRERTDLNFDYLERYETELSSDGLAAGQRAVRVAADYSNLVL